jgi:hypothetical protein
VRAQPLLVQGAAQPAVLVERILRSRERELLQDDARACDAEHAAEILLRPDGAVLADRRTGDGDRLARE